MFLQWIVFFPVNLTLTHISSSPWILPLSMEAWETLMVITEARKALSTSSSSVSALGNHPPPSAMSPLFPCTAVYCCCKVEALLLPLTLPASLQLSWGFPNNTLIWCPGNVSKFLLCSLSLLHPPVRCTFALELCPELPTKAGWSPYLSTSFPDYLVRLFLHLNVAVLKDLQLPWGLLLSCSQNQHIQ